MIYFLSSHPPASCRLLTPRSWDKIIRLCLCLCIGGPAFASPYPSEQYFSCSNPGHPFRSRATLAVLAAVTIDELGHETFVTSGALERLRKVDISRIRMFDKRTRMESVLFTLAQVIAGCFVVFILPVIPALVEGHRCPLSPH